MAKRTVILTVCDMAHGTDPIPDGAQPVTITTGDGTWTLDVCPEHAAHFLLPVIAAGTRTPKTRRRTPAPV